MDEEAFLAMTRPALGTAQFNIGNDGIGRFRFTIYVLENEHDSSDEFEMNIALQDDQTNFIFFWENYPEVQIFEISHLYPDCTFY